MDVPFEKGDPRLAQFEQDLEALGHSPASHLYEPAFERLEVEQAELLHLFMRGLCGDGFGYWTGQVGLPEGTRRIDKKAMGKKDIALTYAFEPIISDRLRLILAKEHLTGWDAQPVLHRSARRDPYPPYFHLVSTNTLPALAPETELYERKYSKPVPWPPGHPLRGNVDQPYATSALFQRGPLLYRRRDLTQAEDFNRTHEFFGEAGASAPELIVSQRAWRVFRKYGIRLVDVEPVLIR